jgi:DNA-binding PadR family transcriptional regulator
MSDDLPVVAYAILGLLARQPLTGYQLARRMDGSVNLFWPALHSQIYPQLAALENAELVRHRQSSGPGPRLKKTYEITAAGRRALGAWVTSPLSPRPVRDELTLRAFNVWMGDPGEAAALFAQHAELHLGEEARLREIAERIRERYSQQELDDPRQPGFGSWVAVQRGIAYHGDRALWCRRVADRLAEVSSSQISET